MADAAALCQCSPNHFMRWFRQMTGQTFIIFLREYRLNAAAEALRTTEDTILSISEQCGFENLSYFNREFKSAFWDDATGIPEIIGIFFYERRERTLCGPCVLCNEIL